MDAIEIRGLCKTFGGRKAVDGLSLSVAAGEIFGLAGPDGAGKSTALRMLASILEPSAGDAWVAGLHTVKDAAAVRDRIGYLSQRFGLYPDLTVTENLQFYADIYHVPRRECRERMEELLAFSGLAPFASRPAAALSGGMRQKLGLACALVHTPRVLLLDEPTNGVDPVSRREFWRLLCRLQERQVTVFLSTSYLDEAERCHRLALLHEGALIACGSFDDIRRRFPRQIVEIHTPCARQACQILRARLGAGDVLPLGARVHITTAEPEQTIALARQALRGAGLPCEEALILSPSLEDVFAALVKHPRV